MTALLSDHVANKGDEDDTAEDLGKVGGVKATTVLLAADHMATRHVKAVERFPIGMMISGGVFLLSLWRFILLARYYWIL